MPVLALQKRELSVISVAKFATARRGNRTIRLHKGPRQPSGVPYHRLVCSVTDNRMTSTACSMYLRISSVDNTSCR